VSVALFAGLTALGGGVRAQTAAPRVETPAAGVRAEIAVGAALPPDQEQARALAHGQGESEPDWIPVDPDEARRTGRPSAGGGLSGSVGRVFTESVPDGWYGRLEFVGLVQGHYESSGAIGGVGMGAELWLADHAGGGGLPLSSWLGYRTPALLATLGVGVLMFEIDEVDGDRGFGIYAPFAQAQLGFEIGETRLVADARTVYRWQWGAPDRAQLQLGVSMVQFIERPVKARPRKPAR